MSEEPEIVRVELMEELLFGFNGLRKTLPQAAAWINDLLEKVPEEFRDQSVFEIESESSYDGGYDTYLRIYYDRPITNEEIEAREAEQREFYAQRKAEQEASERATLAALKAKFEPKPTID